MRMRQPGSTWCRFYVLSLCTCVLVSAIHPSQGVPIGNPEHALESMRQIPQWHCLRYRRFDLVKRCRNYRVAQATNHHELPEPYRLRRLQLASLGSPEKTLQSTEK